MVKKSRRSQEHIKTVSKPRGFGRWYLDPQQIAGVRSLAGKRWLYSDAETTAEPKEGLSLADTDIEEGLMQINADTTLIEAARRIAPVIREHNPEAERERRLSSPVLAALHETGLLRMCTPRSLGGLEADPLTRPS